MDQALLVGVLLIIIGLAVGLFAVALVLNRRAEREEQPAEEPVPQAAAEDSEAGADKAESAVPDHEATPSEAPMGGVTVPEGPTQVSAVTVPEEPKPVAALAVPEKPQPATAAAPQRELIAEIYRDPASAGLILRAGGKDYRAISQIEDEQLRMELTPLAADLASRLVEGLRPATVPAAPRTAAGPGSRSMLEGINAILKRVLADAGDKATGVQLIPDAAGGVKVLIGLKSYALDEVPDEEISRLIRESVAEWEAGQ